MESVRGWPSQVKGWIINFQWLKRILNWAVFPFKNKLLPIVCGGSRLIGDESFERFVVSLYKSGLSIRQIAQITQRGREGIGVILKQNSVRMRGRWVKHKPFSMLSFLEKIALARLFGYLLGDGSISRNKDGRYECSLSFALNEKKFIEDVKNITEFLFHFTPKVKIENGSHFRILLRRSVARYLHEECYYPIGKKSVVNPSIPTWIMKSNVTVYPFGKTEPSLSNKSKG